MTRSVLVTGGNRGIGLAIARALAADGDKVAITYRSGEPPPDLFAVRCDVSSTESVADAVDEVRAQQGAIQVMISNAGTVNDKLLLRMSEDEFLGVVDVNLLGAVRMTKAVLPDMLGAGWGRLVYVSSTVGQTGAPGQTNYAASKAGLIGFARSVAHEYGSRKITANIVAPGLIETDMTADLAGQRRAHIIGKASLNRAGTPDEVAAAARFLASDDASFVTAAVLPVDGGGGTAPR
ncbi:SDR family oxidoreductase [Nocardia mexicana]|uniref:3-oxoacyl-[acyl-carrier-protein] reductase MabA n=1 Tax=Nocardia mexicana TaxID=279262 RepID=A0A370GTK8_9NOCA|nr:SDR family oxidoreductase [Nocardia mexicana]RDI45253.1 3-oxoacyl-[acyl-carrier protein] reductase [Nocardia mexicana]